jgi:hypothetical protein
MSDEEHQRNADYLKDFEEVEPIMVRVASR